MLNLILGHYFNQKVDKLPQSLEKLIFGHNFNQTIDKLPQSLKNLTFGVEFSVLDDSEESSSANYLSKLISMGIYNFSRNVDTIKYLIQNPNSYKDVAQIHQLNDLTLYAIHAKFSHQVTMIVVPVSL